MLNGLIVFWDSSGLISAVMSRSWESPGRQLLLLGEAGLVDMRASREVLRDCENIIRKKRPESLPELAQLLDLTGFAVTLDPDELTIDKCVNLTGYLPDARVLAAAVECNADFFVTHDAVHFLGNPLIGPPETSLKVGSTAEVLAWCQERLREAASTSAAGE